METDMAQLLKRLDRFEQKLDGVQTAIVQMARTEERVSVVLEQNTVLFQKLEKMNIRVSEIEKENASQGKSISAFERISWIIISAVISGIAWLGHK